MNVLLKQSTLVLKKEKGATMIEYVIMASLIAIISIAVVATIGGNVNTMFGTASTTWTNASG